MQRTPPIKLVFQTSEEQRAAIDAWRTSQPDEPSLAEAIRRLLTMALQNPD